MSSLKGLLERSLPGVSENLRAVRYKHGLRRVLTRMSAGEGLVVQGGPFRGMRYLPQLTTGDALLRHAVVPKLLGCYEAELHDTLMCVFGKRYQRIINVGCGEGYYAVGLALRMPEVSVFAFDVDSGERALCREMALANGVADRVEIRGECTVEELRALASGESLVVCDCEGCELTLLRPDLVPGFHTCDVIVEMHDCVDPTISRTISARFAATHEVAILPKIDRDPETYPALGGLTPYQRRLAVSEFRWGPLQWAFLSSRGRAPSDSGAGD
jgi:hypothetical protein